MVLDLKAKKNLSLRDRFYALPILSTLFSSAAEEENGRKLRTNIEELIFPAVSHILRTVLPCQKPNIGGNWKHSNLSYLGTAGSCCASD
ncbi:hypothetical protein T06_5656 [Trichinella sp. T6]|nr:hypothetical protein T06_5656 [Trichinella sp. T6]